MQRIIRYIGIHFGNSNSYICFMDYELSPSGEMLPLYESPKELIFDELYASTPTVLQVACEKKNIFEESFGREALSKSQTNPELIKQYFKIDISSMDMAKKQEAFKNTKKFFIKLYTTYKDQSSFTGYEEHTFISCPLKWDLVAKNLYTKAINEAGFSRITLVEEPLAAIRYWVINSKDRDFFKSSKNILVANMGSLGTEMSLYKYSCNKNYGEDYTVLETAPDIITNYSFSGNEIDHIITEYIQRYLENNLSKQPFTYEQLNGICKLWKENILSPSLTKEDTVKELPLDLCYTVNYLIKENPEKFSGFNRKSFENLLSDKGYLSVFTEMLNKITENIDVIILTGGHSKWYFVKDILRQRGLKFLNAPIESLISYGLALSGKIPSPKFKLCHCFSMEKTTDSLSFSKDDTMLVSASHQDGYVNLWNTNEGTLIKSLEVKETFVDKAVILSLPMPMLCCKSYNGKLSFYELSKDSSNYVKEDHIKGDYVKEDGIREIYLSPLQKMLAVSFHSQIKIFCCEDFKEILSINKDSKMSSICCFSKEEDLFSYCEKNTVNLFDLINKKLLWSQGIKPSNPLSLIRCSCFSLDRETIALGASDGQIYILDVATGNVNRIFKSLNKGVNSLGFLIDKNGIPLLISTGEDGKIIFWNIDGTINAIISKEISSINCVAFSPSGRHFAYSACNAQVKLWEVN